MGPMSASLGSFAVFEFKGILSSFWKGFWKGSLIVVPIVFGLLTYLVSKEPASSSAPPSGMKDLWLGVLVLSLFYGSILGGILGIFKIFIRWFGGWTFLPLTAVPVAVLIAFLLSKGWLAGEANEVVEALKASFQSRDLMDMPEGLRVAHAGGPAALVILVIFIPFILVNFLSVLFEPSVLSSLFDFFFKVGLVVALGAVPSGLLSALVLAGVFVKRIRERYARHEAAPAASS